jgi:hypothetical protein
MRCGDRSVCIEPLVEVLRAPAFPCNDGVPVQIGPPQLYSRAAETRMMDRNFVWTHDAGALPPRTSAGARAFLFDLGASTWQVDMDLGAGLAQTTHDNSGLSAPTLPTHSCTCHISPPTPLPSHLSFIPLLHRLVELARVGH